MNKIKSYFELAFENPSRINDSSNGSTPQQNAPWLARLHHQLDQQLSQSDFSIAQLAKRMQTSERQFYRKIRDLTNSSPNQYFTKYRMKKAKELLESGKYHTVREVCFLVGYKKDSYFSKQFKKEFKESPFELLQRIGVRKSML